MSRFCENYTPHNPHRYRIGKKIRPGRAAVCFGATADEIQEMLVVDPCKNGRSAWLCGGLPCPCKPNPPNVA